GEITAVIGPNGAGKTSLLETIVGVHPCDAGLVKVAGNTVTKFAERAKNFAFLPDAGRLPSEATVRILIEHASSLSVQKNPPPSGLFGDLGRGDLRDKTVGVLSRGEPQRLALFCSLVVGRPIVVLDEPFSPFDPLQLRSVLSAVRSVAAS